MPICPCCEGEAVIEFTALVLGHFQADYASCRACGSLHVVSPHWHEAAHRDLARADKADGGAAWRNATLARLLTTLAPRVPAGPWIDYGSGHGLLVADLASRGYDVRGYDPYRGVVLGDVARNRFTLVTCFEVLEHQLVPRRFMAEIGALLRDDGLLVLSTWLRNPLHGRDWEYLAREAGQHVTFPSVEGFKALCVSAGLEWWMSGLCEENRSLQVHIVTRRQVDVGLAHLLRAAGFEPFDPHK